METKDEFANRIRRDFGQISHILTNDQQRSLLARLNDQLKLWTTLAEIEWAALLVRGNFQNIKLEPFSPAKGPDLEVQLGARSVYFEIKAPWGRQSDFQLLTSLCRIAKAVEHLSEQSYHVHLTSAFSPSDTNEFIRLINRTSKEGWNKPMQSLFHLGQHISFSDNTWSPFLLAFLEEDWESAWIRRDYIQSFVPLMWSSWSKAMSSYDLVGNSERLRHAIASCAVDFVALDEFPLQNFSIAVGKADRLVRQKFISKVMKDTKSQIPAAPSILVIDLSHAFLLTEFDVLAAAFGSTYALQLLQFGLARSAKPDPGSATGCPSHLSCVICYHSTINNQLCRIYSNPRAAYPLHGSELDMLLNRLPCSCETLDTPYSYERTFLTQKIGMAISDDMRAGDDVATTYKLMSTILMSPIFHFISASTLEPMAYPQFRMAAPGDSYLVHGNDAL